jgi:hypothetical protein
LIKVKWSNFYGWHSLRMYYSIRHERMIWVQWVKNPLKHKTLG